MGFKYHEYAELYPMLPQNELSELANNIAEHGLREPIILFNGLVLDGRNRLLACESAGVKPVFRNWEGDELQALEFVMSENYTRRHLDSGQKATILVEYEDKKNGIISVQVEAEKKAAKERRKETEGRPSKEKLGELIPPVNKHNNKSSTRIARKYGTNRKYYEVMKGQTPEVRKEVIAGKKKVPEIIKEARLAKRAVMHAAIIEGNKPLPVEKRKYAVIYADPPWVYECNLEGDRAVENHYPTMTLDKICGLNVSDITLDDAALFLWTTAPKILEAGRVIESWGFTYKTCAIWDKVNIGIGNYFRTQHELLLVAIRGNFSAPEVSARPTWSIYTEKRSKHSSKPDIFYSIIEKMYPDVPRIEMFARNKRDDWDQWGNQSE